MTTSIRKNLALILGGLTVAAVVGASTPADASAAHENTDPSPTGCASSAFVIGSKGVSGGTVYVMASRKCQTNYVLYTGKSQTTTKYGKAAGRSWTRTEVDAAAKSWSMQSYAPGTTAYTGVIKIGDTTTTATCTTGCTWSTSTTTPPSLSSLNAKVDAFVARWNGRYADFDGAYGAQCVDLAQYYNRDVVGARFMTTPYSGGAKDIWSTHDQNRYSRVSASSAPRKGDVAVWGASQGGGYGHIAVVLADAGGSVKTLTQNPGATRVGNITKSGLLGYLRPKS